MNYVVIGEDAAGGISLLSRREGTELKFRTLTLMMKLIME
jgi:hypothetical protein